MNPPKLGHAGPDPDVRKARRDEASSSLQRLADCLTTQIDNARSPTGATARVATQSAIDDATFAVDQYAAAVRSRWGVPVPRVDVSVASVIALAHEPPDALSVDAFMLELLRGELDSLLFYESLIASDRAELEPMLRNRLDARHPRGTQDLTAELPPAGVQ